jgi:Tfp pilus assembly major pilin PilA
MVTILIAAVLTTLAIPMYREVRERSVVRGASADLASAVTQAKLEAAKRNDYVTVSVRGSGSAWCIGVQVGTTGCDCMSATCDITQVDTASLNGARLLNPADFDGSGSTDATLDPRLGMLRNLATGGSVVVRSPSDNWDYRLEFDLSSTAQTKLCTPSGGKHSLAEYPSC